MSYAFLGATTVTSDTVKALQNQANAVLTPLGYNAIAVDGKIGPKTCGAIQESAKFDGGALLAQATQAAGGNLATLCTKFTAPTLKAGAKPPTPTTPSASTNQVIDLDAPTPAPAPAKSSSLLPSVKTKNVMIAGALVAGLVVVVYASKRKPKRATAA